MTMEMYLRKCAALERRIVPGLTHSHYTYKKALHAYARPGAAWLDAGAGRGLFPDWLRREEAEVLAQARPMIGVDPDLASLRDNSSVSHRVVGMLECAPLRSESFDLITSNQVVEHVADPQGALSEIRRLLKPGGVFIFHTPNFLNYQTFIASLLPQGLKFWLASFLEGRHEKDVFPTHYRMNTPGTIQGLAYRLHDSRNQGYPFATGTEETGAARARDRIVDNARPELAHVSDLSQQYCRRPRKGINLATS
jgi:ubiquinone/menaquinone biosynthesis C-methylase UbiE